MIVIVWNDTQTLPDATVRLGAVRVKTPNVWVPKVAAISSVTLTPVIRSPVVAKCLTTRSVYTTALRRTYPKRVGLSDTSHKRTSIPPGSPCLKFRIARRSCTIHRKQAFSGGTNWFSFSYRRLWKPYLQTSAIPFAF